jgi:hypothetical protein
VNSERYIAPARGAVNQIASTDPLTISSTVNAEDHTGAIPRHLPDLTLAQRWIAAGFRVFPVRNDPGHDEHKRPFFPWKDAGSMDLAQIGAWAKQYPGCLWATSPGWSDCCVLDRDPGGRHEDPNAFSYPTQREGGRHFWYLGHLRPSSNKLAPHLDTRGDDSYVVLWSAEPPPVYALPLVPEWIAERCAAGRMPAAKAPDQVTLDDPETVAWFMARLKADVAEYGEPTIGEGSDKRCFDLIGSGRDGDRYGFSLSPETTATLFAEHWQPEFEASWYGLKCARMLEPLRYQNQPGCGPAGSDERRYGPDMPNLIAAQAATASPVALMTAFTITPEALARVSLRNWRERQIAPRQNALGSLLATTGRMMLVAPTGLGKTHLGHAVAYCMGLGRPFLHWTVDRPLRVLIVDGEMPEDLMQERLRDAGYRLGSLTDDERARLDANVFALNRGDFPEMAPLNTPEGQRFIDAWIATVKPDIVIFDNLQSLTSGDLKDTIVWNSMKDWMTGLAARKVGFLLIHHTNDQGRDYGDKTKEWGMDTVLGLEAPEDDDEDAIGREICVVLNWIKTRNRKPGNRSDYRPGKIYLDGNRWAFKTQETAGGSVLGQVARFLHTSGIDDLSIGLLTIRLAELMHAEIAGPRPEIGGLPGAEWDKGAALLATAIRVAKSRAAKKTPAVLARLGHEIKHGAKMEWCWFINDATHYEMAAE